MNPHGRAAHATSIGLCQRLFSRSLESPPPIQLHLVTHPEHSMRAVLQRVTEASVTVEGEVIGQIAHGLLVLLGVAAHDTEDDAAQIAKKIAQLRIFNDVDGKFNLSLEDVKGAILLVS